MLFSGKIQPKLTSKSDVYIMAHGKMSAALFPLLLSSSSSSPRDECMRGKGATTRGHSYMVPFLQSHGGFLPAASNDICCSVS